MKEILISLSDKKVWRNKNEHYVASVATCHYEGEMYEAVGETGLRRLIRSVPWKDAHYNALLRVERGGTTCFELKALKSWLFPTDSRPTQLRKNK